MFIFQTSHCYNPAVPSPLSVLPIITLCWFSWHGPSPLLKKVRRTFWRYADANYEAFCEDLTQLPPSVLQSDDVNSVWSQWRDYFLHTVSKHIPHKLSVSKKTLPWFSPLLKFLSRKRDKLFHLAKTSNSPSAWFSFRKARNNAVTALRSAKRQFLQNLSSSVRNPRQFWSAYYSLRPNRQRIPVHLTNGSVTVESACNKCDLLNSHFVSVFSDPDCYSPVPSSAPDAPGLTSICCSSEDVHRLLTSLPQKTASGPDGISSQMLKHILLVLLRRNYQHFSISRCPLVLSLLTGSYLMSSLSTRLETLNWSQTTVQSLSCHFHRSSLSVLSTTKFCTTSCPTRYCPILNLASGHPVPLKRPSFQPPPTGTPCLIRRRMLQRSSLTYPKHLIPFPMLVY